VILALEDITQGDINRGALTSDVVETFISRPRRGETFKFRERGEARHLDFEIEARRDI